MTGRLDGHEVFLLVAVLDAQDLVDDVAVVGQQDQALGVLVEPADREDALAVADEVDDVAGHVALGRAGDAARLVERDVDVASRRAGSGRPSTRTSSPSFTCVPSTPGAPLTVTRPAAIQASASRRRADAAFADVLVEPHRARDCAESAGASAICARTEMVRLRIVRRDRSKVIRTD